MGYGGPFFSSETILSNVFDSSYIAFLFSVFILWPYFFINFKMNYFLFYWIFIFFQLINYFVFWLLNDDKFNFKPFSSILILSFVKILYWKYLLILCILYLSRAFPVSKISPLANLFTNSSVDLQKKWSTWAKWKNLKVFLFLLN